MTRNIVALLEKWRALPGDHRRGVLDWIEGCPFGEGGDLVVLLLEAAAEPEAKDEPVHVLCEHFRAAQRDDAVEVAPRRLVCANCAPAWKAHSAAEAKAKDEPKATARQVADMLSDEFLRRGQYEGIAASTVRVCSVCGGHGRIYTCVMDAATNGRPCPACGGAR